MLNTTSNLHVNNLETFISLKELIILLVKYGKGRRSVERQSSESPHFINNFEAILNHKIYKLVSSNNFRMFPSDPTGSLDVFFLNSYLISFGGKT